VNPVLKELQRREIVRLHYGRVQIVDPEELQTVVERA
jgi:hypothetical protein